MMSKPWFPGRPCFPDLGKAAEAGQPFEEISDFRLSIDQVWRNPTSVNELEIGNRKLAINYVM